MLEREGFRPTERSRAARRALSGVTAGAVLALGAVVSTLFLNHGTQTTSGDTLASGAQSGGDIVLAESSPTASATVVRTAVATAGSHLPAKATVPDVRTMTPRKATAPGNSGHVRVRQKRASTPATTAPASQTQGTTRSAPTTTPAAPATTTDTTSNSTASTLPTTTASPTTQSTTTPPATTTRTAPPTTTSAADGGGLLNTVTGALNGITQPVFNWFGG
ncbi:MAG TPA: hypothetical protein VFX16_09095 [Pseudonocardiaceae bacterium]|nr:hypothetical protein [Pseudonocardiaceae bacterium]